MKNSCLRVTLSVTPKIVLDQEPAIALNNFLSDEDVDVFNESHAFILYVDDCPCDWQVVHLLAIVPPILSIWPYEPEVWECAGKRMMNYATDGYAYPELFTSNGEEFLMYGDPAFFTLQRVTGRDDEGWTESENVPIEVSYPGIVKHFEFSLLNLQYISVLERLTGTETVYADA